MIALNETNPYAAEVAFTLPLDSDPLTGLTGWTFTLGEVQVKLPGQAWTNIPVIQIVEKGYGRFAVRLSSGQCSVAGDVFIRADISGTQLYFGSDVIGTLGGDIQENSSTGSVPFFLPSATDPVNGAPLTGYTFALGEVRVCLPNSSYVNADPAQIEEIGFGGYRLKLTAAQTAQRGKVFVYANVAGYQRFEGYNTILGAGVGGVASPPEVIPIPVPIVYGDPEYVNHYALSLNRLPQQFRSGTLEYGQVNVPAPALSTFLGTYIPPVIVYEVVVPPTPAIGISNHIANALSRLPQQFRSGELIYDTLDAATAVAEVTGVYVPPAITYEVAVPAVVEGTPNHVLEALNRLPFQFKSGEVF